jgi:hypothetical protein
LLGGEYQVGQYLSGGSNRNIKRHRTRPGKFGLHLRGLLLKPGGHTAQVRRGFGRSARTRQCSQYAIDGGHGDGGGTVGPQQTDRKAG